MNRKEAINYIQGLTNKQLVEFMAEALEGRTSDAGIDDNQLQEHWCLAEVSRTRRIDGKSWDRWELSVLAGHDPAEYPQGWDPNAPLFQLGRCDACGFECLGWAKNLICPVCGEQVYAT